MQKSYNAFTGTFAAVRGISTGIGIAGEGAERLAFILRDALPRIAENTEASLSIILDAWAIANRQAAKMVEDLASEEENSSEEVRSLPNSEN